MTPSLAAIARLAPRKFTCQPPSMTILAMKPAKNTTATDANIQARRVLFFFCSGVMTLSGNNNAQPMTRLAAALSLGGVSKVWNGAGDGISHSRPSAPSQAFCCAFSPLPSIHGNTMKKKK